jgi:hypothetical protein
VENPEDDVGDRSHVVFAPGHSLFRGTHVLSRGNHDVESRCHAVSRGNHDVETLSRSLFRGLHVVEKADHAVFLRSQHLEPKHTASETPVRPAAYPETGIAHVCAAGKLASDREWPGGQP